MAAYIIEHKLVPVPRAIRDAAYDICDRSELEAYTTLIEALKQAKYKSTFVESLKCSCLKRCVNFSMANMVWHVHSLGIDLKLCKKVPLSTLVSLDDVSNIERLMQEKIPCKVSWIGLMNSKPEHTKEIAKLFLRISPVLSVERAQKILDIVCFDEKGVFLTVAEGLREYLPHVSIHIEGSDVSVRDRHIIDTLISLGYNMRNSSRNVDIFSDIHWVDTDYLLEKGIVPSLEHLKCVVRTGNMETVYKLLHAKNKDFTLQQALEYAVRECNLNLAFLVVSTRHAWDIQALKLVANNRDRKNVLAEIAKYV